jgi:hydrogenase/urease accessory protein HupE
LERTLTDVFAEINYLSGESRTALVKPANPRIRLGGKAPSAAKHYLWIGVEHIIYGWDHLLFVIGLTLLVARRQIFGVATAFTLAHSITLALAAFGLLTIPIRPVEILIAASIVLLGIEIIRKRSGHKSLATQRPYLISFTIGLIHGCGFASALSEIGLPKGTELLALLLFNVGVELGQFAVIGLTILALMAIAKIGKNALRRTETVLTYGLASIAMFWVIQRMSDYII